MKSTLTCCLVLWTMTGVARAGADERSPDYLALVRQYADTMIERGRDRYGEQHSPLFAVTLDRQTLSLPSQARRGATAGDPAE